MEVGVKNFLPRFEARVAHHLDRGRARCAAHCSHQARQLLQKGGRLLRPQVAYVDARCLGQEQAVKARDWESVENREGVLGLEHLIRGYLPTDDFGKEVLVVVGRGHTAQHFRHVGRVHFQIRDLSNVQGHQPPRPTQVLGAPPDVGGLGLGALVKTARRLVHGVLHPGLPREVAEARAHNLVAVAKQGQDFTVRVPGLPIHLQIRVLALAILHPDDAKSSPNHHRFIIGFSGHREDFVDAHSSQSPIVLEAMHAAPLKCDKRKQPSCRPHHHSRLDSKVKRWAGKMES
mmetsp:Transcript_58696/g.132848  ORF Transcript_58696/g.132848 Transcript_58696/m.132848 type:complete len:289 (-) Transcript_58696:12-878(-)